ncbi:DUF6686 family protein [Allomuricauda sp. NBRC 101325]|uniref:DUF6686 family protein n=1 Tax=Allomuricauda sp. NBRC 101325 TaxID=1113758 RepID=UPI0024A2E107|nr:DUF6686 family protein [Muricauda sp. NBRC 101325]GLU44129.1 hypothetical protein Musp01_17530 [Muricauda sp. NBRC 101325]
MCKSLNIISQSKNGTVTFCNHSKLFQLIFNNLCFELYEWELEALKSYIEELDIAYWENQLKHWSQQRKIPISVGKKHFIILVNREEITELLTLLNMETRKVELLGMEDINYTFIEN